MTPRSASLRRVVQGFDLPAVFLAAAIALIGVINLQSAASASYGFALHTHQLFWCATGSVAAFALALVDTRFFSRTSYWMYAFVVMLLLLVLAVGTELNGSTRWLNLGVFLMQPSELMKIAVILVTARFFEDRGQTGSFTLLGLARPGVLVGLGVLLIALQPDLGTALITVAIFFTMVSFEGLAVSSIVSLVIVALFSMPLAWNFALHDYQKARVVSFLDVDDDQFGSSWQVRQSVIAFGSGRIFGKGHVEGTQIQKGFVPEHENDFVAANWGEEHGFLGMVGLLGLYLGLILRLIWIGVRARSRFGGHVAIGVAALFFWHVFVNLSMVTGLLPVVGLTLPLMSSGGSSFLTMSLALGLALGVGRGYRSVAG
jgi:rod shape determining protein RodA